jgi:bacillithiol biosynthesis cysteine-adding enzyme BshC
MATEVAAPVEPPTTRPGSGEWIDFRELPASSGGFSELFYDYVYDFPEVAQFYGRNFRDSKSYLELIAAIESRQPDRATLTRVLAEQNRAFGSTPKALENIELLGKPSTFAVVTGQQVGLFGGPMYTIFKAITAIKLAERLKVKFPQSDFVPVFWLEGEDHDFAEMSNASVLDGEGKLARIEYLPGGEMPERNIGAVGELALDGSVASSIAALESALQKTDFTTDVVTKLRECYTTGRTFNEAFASWMNFLFEDYGLVFVSSNHPDLKMLVADVFVREIEEFPKTSQTVIARSAELEERYHAQVKAKSLNLFLFHKGGRYLIEPREHDFSLKGTRHFLQKDELIRIARETPHLLSPNVVLRPIVQDVLLPTVAYVAGPAEVAYHAQLQPVYEHLGVPQPVVYPRSSASFIEERVERVLEKYNVELIQLFDEVDKLTGAIVEQIAEVKLDDIFTHVTNQIHDALNELKFGLKEVDPTLLGSLEGVKSKIDGNLGVLKEKALAAQKRRNEVAVRQIEKAAHSLLPNGSLQERELNITYFMNKYGLELVKWLSAELDIGGFKHQIISL